MSDTARDPLIQRLRDGWEPTIEQDVVTTLEGLPDPSMLWRTVKLGETTRRGDYTFLSDRWYPAPGGQVLRADRPRVWRPLGPSARRWFVGGSSWNYADRNGDPAKPFATLEEALSRISQPAVGIVVELSEYEVLFAFDPSDGDGNRAASGSPTP